MSDPARGRRDGGGRALAVVEPVLTSPRRAGARATAVFDAYIAFIKEGNYVKGRGDGSG